MRWLEVVIPILMLCFPVVGAYALIRVLRLPRTFSTLRWSALWLVTSGLIVIHFAASSRIAWDTRSFVTWFYALFAGTASVGVWFGLVVPAARKARPAYEDAPIRPEGGRRTASLAARNRQDSLPRSAWVVGWGVFAVFTVIAAMVEPRDWRMVLAPLIVWLPSVYYATRGSTVKPEAEPLVDRNSPELLEAYDRLRRLKAWQHYWTGLNFIVLATACSILLRFNQSQGGWFGIIVGVWVIESAFFGTLIAFRRGEAVALHKRLMTAPDGARG